MAEAIIGLGANLGDPERALWSAAWSIGLPILDGSPLYRSRAVETAGPQPDYLNAVLRLQCPERVGPEELLSLLLAVEAMHGRVRSTRHAARTLDLDLLFLGAAERQGGRLTLPHPRAARRRFVLQPLLAISPSGRLPTGQEIAPLLAAVQDQEVAQVSGRAWIWRTRR